MDNIKGVITGDIVGSSLIRLDLRTFLLEAMRRIVSDLSAVSPLNIEFYRGDSFQIVADVPAEALRVAVLIRAGLRGSTPADSGNPWDARLSLGVGGISYYADNVVLSDGEAFQYSGKGFDEMGKRRLFVRTMWQVVNDELEVSTAFADEVISSWSVPQAQVIYDSLLYGMSQKAMAAKSGKTPQNVSKLLNAAEEDLIKLYIKRYNTLINKQLIQ